MSLWRQCVIAAPPRGLTVTQRRCGAAVLRRCHDGLVPWFRCILWLPFTNTCLHFQPFNVPNISCFRTREPPLSLKRAHPFNLALLRGPTSRTLSFGVLCLHFSFYTVTLPQSYNTLQTLEKIKVLLPFFTLALLRSNAGVFDTRE